MERIRTTNEISFELPILVGRRYKYQELSDKTKKLRELGMSYRQIGAALGVDDKLVRQACKFGRA